MHTATLRYNRVLWAPHYYLSPSLAASTKQIRTAAEHGGCGRRHGPPPEGELRQQPPGPARDRVLGQPVLAPGLVRHGREVVVAEDGLLAAREGAAAVVWKAC